MGARRPLPQPDGARRLRIISDLAVLHEQDAAYVDDLLKQVETLMKKLEQEEESST
jgi:ribosome assembly protein YihI (activator of Der GTPase)